MNSTTGNELLRGILDDPASDERRLIYADWLDDQGETERAEFIRVQCELAKIPFEPTKHRHNCKPPRGSVLCHRCEWLILHGGKEALLRRRERELLTARWHLWYGPGIANRASDGIWHTFRRGFVDEVHCRLADWVGTECPHCPDRPGKQHRLYPGGWETCEPCRGTGRIGAHGPTIVACQPVTRVVVTNKTPHMTNGRYWWIPDGITGDPYATLPQFLMNLLSELSGMYIFSTRQAALDALSAALLRWAK